MTHIIRLNESINDYISRPVVTRLGEPDLAIRPSTYLDALGASTNIEPEQIIVDGSIGQNGNPTPFIGAGTGEMTIKSDADGVYLAMSQKGIRTAIGIDSRNDRGTLAIIKYRLNDIFTDSRRLLSVGSALGGTGNFSLETHLDPERTEGPGGYSAQLDNIVHTIAIYRGLDGYYIIEDTEKYAASWEGAGIPDSLTGVGINTRYNANTPANDLDLYNFELYLDIALTEQQIIDYLKTL